MLAVPTVHFYPRPTNHRKLFARVTGGKFARLKLSSAPNSRPTLFLNVARDAADFLKISSKFQS